MPRAKRAPKKEQPRAPAAKPPARAGAAPGARKLPAASPYLNPAAVGPWAEEWRHGASRPLDWWIVNHPNFLWQHVSGIPLEWWERYNPAALRALQSGRKAPTAYGPRATPPARHSGPGKPKHTAADVGGLGVFVATAYGPPWGGIQGTGRTRTGIDLRNSPHLYIVAVDPSVIPLHTKLNIVPNPFGDDNIVFSAEDTGGAIVGDRIDFYDWRGRASQDAWGTRNVTVYKVASGGAGAPRATGPLYVNPLAHARVTPERIDQGVDYAGTGYLVAIADATVTESVADGSGWEGEGYVEYKITQSGELYGAYVYYAEGITPTVNVGDNLRAGDRVANLRTYMPHGIEIGFAAGSGQESYYRYHDGAYKEGTATRPGIAFSNLVERLGGPPGKIEGEVVGLFPEYMQSGEPAPAVTPSASGPYLSGGGVAPSIYGQFDWPSSVLSAFVQLQRGSGNASHHSHSALAFTSGIEYLEKSNP